MTSASLKTSQPEPAAATVRIDLRSDTVTQPSQAMRQAMAAAEVGDDVYGEDPTVNRLQSVVAERTGHEAALFCTSGTQGNLLALLAHCERGDEYIVGQTGHTYKYEGGGAAVLGSIQPQPLDFQPDGTLDLDQVRAVVKPLDPHFARTRLLCQENTQGGKVLALDYLRQSRVTATDLGIGHHLDGARVFNAAVASDVDIAEITTLFDSVSICLSKGLGCPAGTVLAGNRELIERARRWRKVVGGGMRQSGILAAAGLFALDNNVQRLSEDHANARALAEGLSRVSPFQISDAPSNMVFINAAPTVLRDYAAYMGTRSIAVRPASPMRLVAHLDITRAAIDEVIAATAAFFDSKSESTSP